ncbi:MAG: inorganic diphosphatase [Weeksellaceae bacterium]
MDLSKLSTGKNPPAEVNVLIEITQGTYVKYEVDKESGYVMVDRFSYTSMPYPFNYGFIPNTKAEDGDPTDVLVISSQPVTLGTVIAVRVIGMLEMEDEAGIDTKIIAVPTKKIDPFYANVEEITDLDQATLAKIKHFFDHYKELEPNKWVKTKDFLGKEKAYESITQSMK